MKLPKFLEKYEFFKMPKIAILFAFCALVMVAAIIEPLSKNWSGRQDYAFGYLMPFFALYVLYDRWGKIFGYFKNPSVESKKYSASDILIILFFGAMFFCGITTYLFGVFFYAVSSNFGAPTFIATFGFSFSAFAMAFFAGEKNLSGSLMPVGERVKFAGLFMFPCFAWLVSAPIFEVIENKISLFLLSIVAAIVYNVMDMLGYVVTLSGNTLTFPNGSVGVADACSGIRSLTACLFAGSFLAAVFLDKLWKKVLLVAFSMVFAFVNNVIRAMFLSFWAYTNGPDSISGFVHDAAGYFVMIMTIVCLLLLMPIFQFSAVPPEFRDKENDRGND